MVKLNKQPVKKPVIAGNFATIADVHLDLDAIAAKNHVKSDLGNTYFSHLSGSVKEAAADELWSKLKGKEAPVDEAAKKGK